MFRELALFDARVKSRRVGLRPAFLGQYQGLLRPIPISGGRILFCMVGGTGVVPVPSGNFVPPGGIVKRSLSWAFGPPQEDENGFE
jgi:hypothetical protein